MTAAAPSLKRALPPVYAAAALRIAFPLVVLPVMAARLGPEEFGRLGLCLVWAGLLATLVEGGFLAAATRAAVRADADGRRRMAAQVFSARCVLSLAVPPLAALALRGEPASSVALVAALACGLGWPATWYLQASEQLHRWAFVEIAVYAVWLAAALAFAASVDTYLLMNAAAMALLALLGWRWLGRDLAPALWSRAAVGPGLRLGATMMPVSITGAAYSYALPAVASVQMSRGELGLYYLVDRVVRALVAAADPLIQVVYPRLVARFADGARAALRYAARWAALAFAGGLVLWALAAWTLPWWAQRGYERAQVAPVFALLGALLPLLLGWRFFGYWMLASGRHDSAYRACIVAGAVCGVAGALLFAARGAVALAAVALAVECIVITLAVAGIAWETRQSR